MERKSIMEFIRSIFRKQLPEVEEFPAPPSEEMVDTLINRTLGKEGENHPDGEEISLGKEETDDGKKTPDKDEGKGKKSESCPYATRRAIVESIAEIRRFAEENRLAASVIRQLLLLLAEIALGALKGKISRHILETLLHAVERQLDADDGLPHINGTVHRPDSTSIFDVAAEARN